MSNFLSVPLRRRAAPRRVRAGGAVAGVQEVRPGGAVGAVPQLQGGHAGAGGGPAGAAEGGHRQEMRWAAATEGRTDMLKHLVYNSFIQL